MTSHNVADEWNELIATWEAGTLPSSFDVAAWRDEAFARQRRLRRSVIAETLMTVVFVASAAYVVLRSPGTFSIVAGDVGLFLVLTWTFSIWNRRGLWRPAGKTTEAFVKLARVSCARRIHAAWFTYVVVLGQVLLVFFLPSGIPKRIVPQRWATTAVIVSSATAVLFIAWAVWTHARAKRELAHWNELLADLNESPEDENT